jgi:hypothetical protein
MIVPNSYKQQVEFQIPPPPRLPSEYVSEQNFELWLENQAKKILLIRGEIQKKARTVVDEPTDDFKKPSENLLEIRTLIQIHVRALEELQTYIDDLVSDQLEIETFEEKEKNV